jgi:hypothetical protein
MDTRGRYLNRIFSFLLIVGLLLTLNVPQPVIATGMLLSPASSASVTGVVRDGTPGGHTYPLYAKMVFTSPGQPTVATFTNPFTGAYSANLVLGAVYTAAITPTLPGYIPGTVSFTPTASPFTKNFTVQADLAPCNAPGYTNNRVFSETFDAVTAPDLPSGWALAKMGTGTATWIPAMASTSPSGVLPVSSPNMAMFNSSSATAGDATLLFRTSATSLASLSTAVISFWMYHDAGFAAKQDRVQAAVSTDGSVFYMVGTTIPRYSATPGWTFHQVNINSYAGAGKPGVYIGLVGTSDYGNNILIDDLSINSGTCLMSGGGLVSGFVNSSPSGRAVISALVANTARPSEQSYSVSRGEDSALQDGFFQFFTTVSGLQNFSATAIRHLWAERIVNVANDAVTRLDLSPTTAWVTASLNPVTVTLASGSSTNRSLIFSNPGTLAANFTIQPAAGVLTSGSSGMESIPYREDPANDPAATRSDPVQPKKPEATSGEMAATQAPPANPGGIVLKEFPLETPPPTGTNVVLGGGPRQFGAAAPFPGTAGYRFATASCDGETFYVFGGQTGGTSVNEVWMFNPAADSWTAKAPMPVAEANMRAACIDGKIYVVGGYAGGVWNNSFQIYTVGTNTWTSTTQPLTGAPMVVTYNGLLYAMGGATGAGASSLANVYNPATGLWSALAGLPTATRYAGAVVYKDLIFIIGGTDTADVQAYNPASNSWNNAGPDLPGPRMDPVVGWYGDQIYLLNGGGNGGNYWQAYPEGYMLNASAWPGGSWTLINAPLPKPKSAPASICAGNRLWSVGGTVNSFEEHITQFYDDGLMCNRTYAAVPWLSVSPQSGSILLVGTKTISLVFNASVAPYNTPGVYHAVLKLNSDVPYEMADIPVTLVVVKTCSSVTVSPGSVFKTVYPGKYASYDFTVTNTSGAADSFSIDGLGISPGWTATINPPTFTNLPNGGSAAMNIKMYPPAGAKEGNEGVVSIAVKVHDNPSEAASFSMVVTVQSYKVYLPVSVH